MANAKIQPFTSLDQSKHHCYTLSTTCTLFKLASEVGPRTIWRTGKFPEDWHKAVIIPIPKPGKDKTEATNYRPIALTSCICKTMEIMIDERLVWFLESNNLISGNQAGFRKN